jgi:hypothetical protein
VTQLTLSYDLSSLASSGGLVDRLVAGRRARAEDVKVAANLVELEVIGIRSVLDLVDLVLRVAGVSVAYDPRTLVAVATCARDSERLVDVAAIGFLITLLIDLRYGWDGYHKRYRQHHHQSKQLLQLLPPSLQTRHIKLR